jgi:hypothetical protein
MPVTEKLRFHLSGQPLGEDEQVVFTPDLAHMGLDENVWPVLNTLLNSGSSLSIPKVLRAYSAQGRLAGVAYLIECRGMMRNTMGGPWAQWMDLCSPRFFLWGRKNVLVDGYNNPGFVVPGLPREAFVRQAITFLCRRYVYGLIMGERETPVLPFAIREEMPDWGEADLEVFSLEALFAKRRNLRRKVRKFMNKGGDIVIFRGAMPEKYLSAAAGCLSWAERLSPTKLPFQDIYLPLSMNLCRLPLENLVHVVAFMDGVMKGYHSFLISGADMYCLSGGFQREGKTNYHAYENILVEAMRYAGEAGIRRLYFGPIFNPAKVRLMPSFSGWELHFYSRFGFFRRMYPMLSKASGPMMLEYTRLSEKMTEDILV